MSYSIVPNKSDAVARWAFEKFGRPVIPPFYAMGIEDELGEPKGAFIWHEFTGDNIELTVFAPGALKPNVVREGFDYAFNQLGVSRITVRCPANRGKLHRLIMAFGWRLEGILRRFYGDEDCYVFGMIREDCHHLRKPH